MCKQCYVQEFMIVQAMQMPVQGKVEGTRLSTIIGTTTILETIVPRKVVPRGRCPGCTPNMPGLEPC